MPGISSLHESRVDLPLIYGRVKIMFHMSVIVEGVESLLMPEIDTQHGIGERIAACDPARSSSRIYPAVCNPYDRAVLDVSILHGIPETVHLFSGISCGQRTTGEVRASWEIAAAHAIGEIDISNVVL